MNKHRSPISILLNLLVIFIIIACNNNDPKNVDPNTTVKDLDGNVYHTITIGTQVWMVENLKTTKFNDGLTISGITDNSEWAKLKTSAYCTYNNDVTMDVKYGKLYNWFAVNSGKLAPIGWHVPTDAEWRILENYVNANLGVSVNSAKALSAKTDWNSSTTLGAVGNDLSINNSSGFNAQSGGYRNYDGKFNNINTDGFWWSSTKDDSFGVWYRFLNYNLTILYPIFTNSIGEPKGLSVRCIKD